MCRLTHSHPSTQPCTHTCTHTKPPFPPPMMLHSLLRQEMKAAVSPSNNTMLMMLAMDRGRDGNTMIQRTQHSHNLINTHQCAASTTRIANNPTLFVAHTCIHCSRQSVLSSPISLGENMCARCG